jgi:argininosuccinate lyase
MRAAAEDGYTTATSVADELVRRGVAFRSAHHIVGELVARAEAGGCRLGELPAPELSAVLASSDDPAAAALARDEAAIDGLRRASTVEAALAGADVRGGTAPPRVRAALAAARERLGG